MLASRSALILSANANYRLKRCLKSGEDKIKREKIEEEEEEEEEMFSEYYGLKNEGAVCRGSGGWGGGKGPKDKASGRNTKRLPL